jgi:hypothetical protein
VKERAVPVCASYTLPFALQLTKKARIITPFEQFSLFVKKKKYAQLVQELQGLVSLRVTAADTQTTTTAF